MTRFWLGLGTLGVAFVMAGGCSGSSMPDSVPALGTEGKACRTDGTAPCDAPLSCYSNLCVNAGAGTGTGGSAGTGAGGTDATGSGGTDTTGSGGTEPNGDAGSDGTGVGGETDPGVGGSTGNPGELDCRTEENYVICGNAGLTWEEAQEYCVSQGGALVKIDNADENNDLVELVTEPGSIWIGANDRDTEGDFRWTDGSEVAGENAHWAGGQPNNSGEGENCVVLHADGGEWNDVDCSLTEFNEGISFVCEKP